MLCASGGSDHQARNEEPQWAHRHRESPASPVGWCGIIRGFFVPLRGNFPEAEGFRAGLFSISAIQHFLHPVPSMQSHSLLHSTFLLKIRSSNSLIIIYLPLGRSALTVASNEVRTSAVSTGVGSLSVVVRERVCSLANGCQHLNLGASAVQ
jgi:hypothetical protein